MENSLFKLIEEIVSKLQLKCRIKTSFCEEISDWGSPLTLPEKSYVEIRGVGPVHENEVEWIDIDPVKLIKKGKLLREIKDDRKATLIYTLVAKKINFKDYVNFVRIQVPQPTDG